MNLVRPFSEEEVQAAIKGLNGEGSPRLDGFLVLFSKDFWDLVMPDVMAIFKEFRQVNFGMERINKSHLFLRPKC